MTLLRTTGEMNLTIRTMIKIKNVEIKQTKTGSPYKSLVANDGTKEVSASIWNNDRLYSQVIDGAEVDGVLQQNGKFWNLKSRLSEPLFVKKDKRAEIHEFQDRKLEGIQQTLEVKDHSIKISSTFRDATLFTIAEFQGKGGDERTLRTAWVNWRRWLWENYGNISGYPSEVLPEEVNFDRPIDAEEIF